MPFTSTVIPPRASSKKAASISPEELKQILSLLHKGQVVTDDQVFTEASKSGKTGARVLAYAAGHKVRDAALAADPKLTPKELVVKTWADPEIEGGFRWGLRLK